MKRLLIVSLLFLTQTIQVDEYCLGYVGRKLRQGTFDRVRCNCNCSQQQKVWYDQGHGYGCARCGHRRIPTDVMTPENTRVISNKTNKENNAVKQQQKTKSKKILKKA